VHANAGFTVMLTHDALRRVNGCTVEKETDFGLDHDLRVSARGRGSTVLHSLDVAGSSMADVPCAVFDLPTTNWEGMLGVGWLDAARPVVDFGSRTLSFGAPIANAAARVEFVLDEALGRYVIELVMNGESAPFVVSTVAGTTLDLAFARDRGLDLTEPTGEEHGPGGAVVPVYRTRHPVSLAHAGGPIATLAPTVYDTFGYVGRERSPGAREVAGYLGADVLLETGAVLDFG
jgi:hypothetical protein